MSYKRKGVGISRISALNGKGLFFVLHLAPRPVETAGTMISTSLPATLELKTVYTVYLILIGWFGLYG